MAYNYIGLPSRGSQAKYLKAIGEELLKGWLMVGEMPSPESSLFAQLPSF